MNQSTRVAIGLGSNLGDRVEYIQSAVEAILEDLFPDASCSPLFETPAWGGVAKKPFLNAVLVGNTDWKPPAILNYLKELERELGRTPGPRYADREIDLDLLVFGESEWNADGLVVPHPELAKRAFVLVPFCEVWPEWKDPRSGKTAAELLQALPPDPTIKEWEA
jgi:2-amino-4-hydroxy-6-hydroxymethyldihydropteridine diphosphokinase